MCSMIRPWAAAASCDSSTRGTATPPLPSPPMTARCSIIASEMNDCPTGVRTTVPPCRRRHLVDGPGGRDVGDHRARLPRQGDGRGQRDRPLLGQRHAGGGHQADALAVRVVGEADVGAARPHDGLQLRHRLGLRLGAVRERGRRIVVDGQHRAPEHVEPPRREHRRGAVAAVDRDAQAAAARGVRRRRPPPAPRDGGRWRPARPRRCGCDPRSPSRIRPGGRCRAVLPPARR